MDMNTPTTSTTDPESTSAPAMDAALDGHHQHGISWPAHSIPVEIFNLIIQFVSHRDVQMMRLVNHEFDSKLAEIYFKVVVVPFRPEFEALYGCLSIKGNTSDEGSPSHHGASPIPGSDNLLSPGHRVFQQFGDKMSKFALALEINENELAYPPLKITQEIAKAPWGLYRWPIMDYQRYSQVEGLELLANETSYMARAFAYLKSVTEIGISCDGGLGWLHGSDITPFSARTPPAVFRPPTYQGDVTESASSDCGQEEQPLSLSILQQMACNAGYPSEDWPQVILRLLEDEGCDGVIAWIERTLPSGRLTRDRVPHLKVDSDTTPEAIVSQIKNAIAGISEVVPETALPSGLVPRHLSTAQAEMLLELEWAHRALMQSYRLAVLDNKDSFQNLKVLNIARCPSSRITTWCDDAFWEDMTSIEAVHLGVIPDWREIDRNSSGIIEQQRVAPSNACWKVFTLLHRYIGRQQNIKNVSFEWVCGGEFAMGKSQRDRYILPAPVLADRANMISVRHHFSADDVVMLPYVQKLSLKNCWFSPHVFTFFLEHMFLENLTDVVLESVSLTGPPSPTAQHSIYPRIESKPANWPWPLCVGAEPGCWFKLIRPLPHNQVPPVAPVAVAGQVQLFGHPHVANPFAPPGGNQAPVPVANPVMHAAALAGHHPAGSAFAINSPSPPAQGNDSVNQRQWRAWSWPHVLVRLGMAPDSVHRHLRNSTPDDTVHEANLKNIEKHFAAQFKDVLEHRMDNGQHQTMTFKSCGYALIDSPNIDNWKIIPGYPIQVSHSTEFVNRLRELDNVMLTTHDNLLAKIIHYMPDKEENQLRNLFNFDFGWADLYDPVVAQAAVADGNPNPGQGRFFGSVSNKPSRAAKDMMTLLKSEGRLVGSYWF